MNRIFPHNRSRAPDNMQIINIINKLNIHQKQNCIIIKTNTEKHKFVCVYAKRNTQKTGRKNIPGGFSIDINNNGEKSLKDTIKNKSQK